MDKKRGVTQFLMEHAAGEPVSFHMPGHKGSWLYREYGYGAFLERIMDCDVTEIPGADNLFQTEGIIRETMDRYKAIYGVKESFLLVGGSSAGLIAAIMTCVPPGGKLIMARNCHKSVFNGLRLAGGQPVYAYPQELAGAGISGSVLPSEIKRCLAAHPDASAVILPSPNYYGICSDIKEIADMVHDAGMVLIVDQAHGAHLKLFDRYAGSWAGGTASGRETGGADGKSGSLSDVADGLQAADRIRAAENQGADVIVESTHKTLASYTQSAIVNLNTDRVDQHIFADKLQMIESTSPSYLLMASLDINADLMEKRGQELTKRWEADLRYFYEEARRIPGLRVLEHPMLDPTKINLDMSGCGLTGLQLEERLMERGIFVELVTGDILMCMTGIGNRRCDYDRLLAALTEISGEQRRTTEQQSATGCSPCTPCVGPAGGLPEQVGPGIQPTLMEKRPSGRQAVTLKRLLQREIPTACERVPISRAAGRVCGSSIVPYPPGIPILCPGEIMDAEVLAYAAALREAGEKVMGIDEAGCVLAGKEPDPSKPESK